MIVVGSKVTLGKNKSVFEVISIDKFIDNPDYDICWLMWGDNENYQEIKGTPLYSGNFRKELTELSV